MRTACWHLSHAASVRCSSWHLVSKKAVIRFGCGRRRCVDRSSGTSVLTPENSAWVAGCGRGLWSPVGGYTQVSLNGCHRGSRVEIETTLGWSPSRTSDLVQGRTAGCQNCGRGINFVNVLLDGIRHLMIGRHSSGSRWPRNAHGPEPHDFY